jgi:hypothetical protein
MIKIRYSAVDGFSKRKSFKSLKGARKYAIGMLGKYPSFGSYYAVSDDGVGKIEVIEGVKLRDLFGDDKDEGADKPFPICGRCFASHVGPCLDAEDAENLEAEQADKLARRAVPMDDDIPF